MDVDVRLSHERGREENKGRGGTKLTVILKSCSSRLWEGRRQGEEDGIVGCSSLSSRWEWTKGKKNTSRRRGGRSRGKKPPCRADVWQ